MHEIVSHILVDSHIDFDAHISKFSVLKLTIPVGVVAKQHVNSEFTSIIDGTLDPDNCQRQHTLVDLL